MRLPTVYRKKIRVGARSSPLSMKQVEEVLAEIRHIDPEIVFEVKRAKTKGDIDQKTSLRSLAKCNFFTKEIDQMLMEGRCDIAIHSAKDLPEPLLEGIQVSAVTKGVDPRDSLVMPEGVTLESLPKGARIGSSSPRRDAMILRYGCEPVDIRGAIGQRLAYVREGRLDGVIIPEVALIRLGLHPNRYIFDDETAPLQGRLAICSRCSDPVMHALFQQIDEDALLRA